MTKKLTDPYREPNQSKDALSIRKAAISAAMKEFPVDAASKRVEWGAGNHSSNASLGIDSDVAMGISNASGYMKTSKEMNSGAGQRNASLDDNYGTQDYSSRIGTQGAREDMTIGPKADRGQFGTSARSGGHAEGSTQATLGDGARAIGTDSTKGGVPGQTGSMALARQGLRSGGDGRPQAKQVRGPANKSLIAADKGLRTGGTGDE